MGKRWGHEGTEAGPGAYGIRPGAAPAEGEAADAPVPVDARSGNTEKGPVG